MCHLVPAGAAMNSSSDGLSVVEHSWSSSKIHLDAFLGFGLVGVTGGRGSTTCSTYFRFGGSSTDVGIVEGASRLFSFSSVKVIGVGDKGVGDNISSSSSLGGISFNTSM